MNKALDLSKVQFSRQVLVVNFISIAKPNQQGILA